MDYIMSVDSRNSLIDVYFSGFAFLVYLRNQFHTSLSLYKILLIDVFVWPKVMHIARIYACVIFWLYTHSCRKEKSLCNLWFFLAPAVTSAPTCRTSDIVHDPVERESKVFTVEEKNIVRRRSRVSLRRIVVVSFAKTQYPFTGFDHRDEPDYQC